MGAISSVGRAPRLHRGCRQFEPVIAHHPHPPDTKTPVPVRERALAPFRFAGGQAASFRSEEHTSELQSLMRISYAVFCLTKKNKHILSRSLITIHKSHLSYIHLLQY